MDYDKLTELLRRRAFHFVLRAGSDASRLASSVRVTIKVQPRNTSGVAETTVTAKTHAKTIRDAHQWAESVLSREGV